MSRARPVIAGSLAAGVCMAAAATILSARETTRPLPESTERLLYLRSGQTADRVFLTFDALAADVYWIRSIQHYGRDRKSTRATDRFALLQPLLDLTTTLDPYFSIAYRFGALFLAMDPPNGPGRPDQSIALLEKGLKTRADRWQYAHDIGFIHYWYTSNYGEAATWFKRAAAMPGAPEWLGPLAGVTLASGGDRQGARRLLQELLSSEEDYVRQSAERSLAQLQTLDAIDSLQALVERFHVATGRYPQSWIDLVRARLLAGVPADQTGTPFLYDAATHEVRLAPESALAPLPRGLAPR